MAILKKADNNVELKGKSNGHIFTNGTQGLTLRTGPGVKNVLKPLQTNKKTFLYKSSQLWKNLSSLEKTGWNSFALNYPYFDIFGNEKFYSGYQMFQKSNQNFIVANLPQVIVAPPVSIVQPMDALHTNVGLGQFGISWSNLGSHSTIVIFVSKHLMPETAFNFNQMRLVKVLNDAPVNGSTNFGVEYLSTWQAGNLIGNFWLYVRVINQISGDATAPIFKTPFFKFF